MPLRTPDDVLASVADVYFDEKGGHYTPSVDAHGGDDDTPLHVLAWRNDADGAGILIAAGADVNALGDRSQTPLHVAVSQRNAELTQALLNAGADPEIIDEFNNKALPDSLRGIDLANYFEELNRVDPSFDAVKFINDQMSKSQPNWPPQPAE